MKSKKEFIDSCVKIGHLESCDCFGHYPFQLVAENKDGGLEINALALGGDVEACYRRAAEYKTNGAKKIYMSLDFPAGDDIDKDFVAIFSIEDGEINISAIPYNTEDGKTFDVIEKSSYLTGIKEQFIAFL